MFSLFPNNHYLFNYSILANSESHSTVTTSINDQWLSTQTYHCYKTVHQQTDKFGYTNPDTMEIEDMYIYEANR